MLRRLTPPIVLMAPPEDSGEGDTPPAPSGGAEKPDSSKPADEAPKDEGKTFTQAEVDRIIAGRFQKFADYDDIKKQLGELHDANATEQEKAAKAAREEGRQEALGETAPRLVRAEFKAAAKGRMEQPALDSLLEDLDLSKFLTDKGEVDVDRIEQKVAALAPEPAPNKPPLGGGARKTEKPKASTLGEAIQNRLAKQS